MTVRKNEMIVNEMKEKKKEVIYTYGSSMKSIYKIIVLFKECNVKSRLWSQISFYLISAYPSYPPR